MSVSYIVPVWREDVYQSVCFPWVQKQVEEHGAELIEVRDSKSIFQAHERGRRSATNRYLFYVHDDVQLMDPDDLTPQVVKAFEDNQKLGLLGPVGKVRRVRVPWWLNPGSYVGHYCRRGDEGEIRYQHTESSGEMTGRMHTGEISWHRFAQAALVDGFFLCEDRERVNIPWDLKSFGKNWHGYDMDRCFQTHHLGYEVGVPPWLFLHDNAGHAGYKGTNAEPIDALDHRKRRVRSEGDRLWLSDLEVVNRILRAKWRVK